MSTTFSILCHQVLKQLENPIGRRVYKISYETIKWFFGLIVNFNYYDEKCNVSTQGIIIKIRTHTYFVQEVIWENWAWINSLYLSLIYKACIFKIYDEK